MASAVDIVRHAFVLQSGFGVSFCFGLANFRKVVGEFLSEVKQIFPAIRSHLRTLALETGDFSKKLVVLVKRKNGFTKTSPWTENPGKQGEERFSKSICAFY